MNRHFFLLNTIFAVVCLAVAVAVNAMRPIYTEVHAEDNGTTLIYDSSGYKVWAKQRDGYCLLVGYSSSTVIPSITTREGRC